MHDAAPSQPLILTNICLASCWPTCGARCICVHWRRRWFHEDHGDVEASESQSCTDRQYCGYTVGHRDRSETFCSSTTGQRLLIPAHKISCQWPCLPIAVRSFDILDALLMQPVNPLSSLMRTTINLSPPWRSPAPRSLNRRPEPSLTLRKSSRLRRKSARRCFCACRHPALRTSVHCLCPPLLRLHHTRTGALFEFIHSHKINLLTVGTFCRQNTARISHTIFFSPSGHGSARFAYPRRQNMGVFIPLLDRYPRRRGGRTIRRTSAYRDIADLPMPQSPARSTSGVYRP